MRRLPVTTAITPGAGPEGLGDWLEGLCVAGVEAVQIREKQLSDLDLLELTRRMIAVAAGRLKVLVNGRADVALVAGADGVHLASSGLPVAAVRELLGPAALVGRSTHRLEEIAGAGEAGVDYVYYSPIFDTPGKAPAVGLAGLERAVATGVPVVALGGLSLERIGSIASTGSAGIAGIRMFADPSVLGGLRTASGQFRSHSQANP